MLLEAAREAIGQQRLGSEQLRLEQVSLGLRTSGGVSIGAIDLVQAQPHLEAGLLERRNGHLVLTERGMLLANEVALALI